jgi:hypothetical protein
VLLTTVADCTTVAQALSAQICTLYDVAPVTTDQSRRGVTETPVEPFVGVRSVGVSTHRVVKLHMVLKGVPPQPVALPATRHQ